MRRSEPFDPLDWEEALALRVLDDMTAADIRFAQGLGPVPADCPSLVSYLRQHDEQVRSTQQAHALKRMMRSARREMETIGPSLEQRVRWL